MRVAIMQPYFFPYAGYFRLIAGVDLFCILDSVQFPRRGWVHRNRFTNAKGNPDWLTLPLNKAPRDTLIQDLTFPDAVHGRMEAALIRFPILSKNRSHPMIEQLLTFNGNPVDYLERTLKKTCETLGISTPMVRASSLPVPGHLKGVERILAIAQHLQASTYLNASGGKALYDEATFRNHGLDLAFLPDWQGSFSGILERLLVEDTAGILNEIQAQI